jgi:hypothetical protein
LRLARGHILLIAGGAIVAFSFVASNYYASQFLQEIQNVNRYTVQPGGTLEFQQNITSSDGAYVVAFPDYSGTPVQASVRVDSPSGATVLVRDLDLPFYSESFAAQTAGNYTLTLANEAGAPMDASVIFGEQAAVGEVIGMPTAVSTAISSLLLVAGIIVLIAGGAIMVIDRRKAQKMKQFGDMSDLV